MKISKINNRLTMKFDKQTKNAFPGETHSHAYSTQNSRDIHSRFLFVQNLECVWNTNLKGNF